MRKGLLLTGPLVVATLLLGGCAPESESPGPDETTRTTRTETTRTETTRQPEATTALAAALEATPATDVSVEYFGFTDISALGDGAIVDVLVATTGTGFQNIPVMGLDAFATNVVLAPELLPSPGPGASASTIGVPPEHATRMTGVADPASVYAHASGERTDLAGGTLIVRRADFEVDLSDDEFLPSLLARLNVIWYSGDTTITGATRQAVTDWAANDGPSLAEHYAGVAECLGDAVGALVVSADYARTSGDVGIGIGGAPDAAVQTLCLRVEDAEAAVSEIEDRLASDTDDVWRRPLSEIVPDAVVEDAGQGWVRVRTQGGQSDVFSRMLQLGSLYNVTG